MLRFLLLPAALLWFCYAYMTGDQEGMLLSLLALGVHNLIYALQDVRGHLSFLLLQVTFWVFLLGQMAIRFGTGGQVGGDWRWWFAPEIIQHTLLSLYIALMGLFVGERIFYRKRPPAQKINRTPGYDVNSVFIRYLRLIALIAFFVTLLPRLYVLYDEARFVLSQGYLAYYVSYAKTTTVPNLFVKLYDIFPYCFAVYLATMPKLKRALPVILLFFAQAVLALASGGRGMFALDVMLLFWYFMLRNMLVFPGNKPWLGRKLGIVILASIPFIMVALVMVNAIRFGSERTFTFTEGILEFIQSQGGSVSVISYEKQYEAYFREPGWRYLFDPLVRFVDNLLGLNLPGMEYQGFVLERVQGDYKFNLTLSYYAFGPWRYLQGEGPGSSYIAEAYIAYKYIGVAVFSLIFGALTHFFDRALIRRWWLLGIGMMALRDFLYTPRAAALDWLAQSLSITSVASVLLIGLVAGILAQLDERIRSRKPVWSGALRAPPHKRRRPRRAHLKRYVDVRADDSQVLQAGRSSGHA